MNELAIYTPNTPARYRYIIKILIDMLLELGKNYSDIGKRVGITRQNVRDMHQREIK